MRGRLLKSLYGLKQAPRIWAKTLYKALEALGFRRLDCEPSVFSRFSTQTPKAIFIGPELVITVYSTI